MSGDLSSRLTLLSLVGSRINDLFIAKSKLETEIAKTKIESVLERELTDFRKTVHYLLDNVDTTGNKQLSDAILAIKKNIIVIESNNSETNHDSPIKLKQKFEEVSIGLAHLIKELKVLLKQFDSTPKVNIHSEKSPTLEVDNHLYDELFKKLERFSLSKIELEKRIAKVKILEEIYEYRNSFMNKMDVSLKKMTLSTDSLEVLENALNNMNHRLSEVKTKLDELQDSPTEIV